MTWEQDEVPAAQWNTNEDVPAERWNGGEDVQEPEPESNYTTDTVAGTLPTEH